MTTITELGTVLQELLTTTADEVGRESGFIRRQRKLSGSSYAQALVFGWMSNPASTMSELAGVAASVGVSISKQGLDERFSEQSATFMQCLLARAVGRLMESEAQAVGVMSAFRAVHVQDSTSISLPAALHERWQGCNATGTGSAGLKVSVDWELVKGGLSGLYLHAAKSHDQSSPLTGQGFSAKSLHLRDLGYFNLKRFAEQSAADSYFLSRLKASCNVYTLEGQVLDWSTYLLQCTDDHVQMQVLVGADRLPCRLLAWRVPADVADQRRQRLKDTATDHARPVSPKRYNTAQWSIYMTNAPLDVLPLAHAQVLVRLRWQIELLFKLWKSDGLLDEWRSTDPYRILTECFAKLLALLIQHWCLLLGVWHVPNRSLHQAHLLLRKFALLLACTLSDLPLLIRLLTILQNALASCKMTSARRYPHTFQLILGGLPCLS